MPRGSKSKSRSRAKRQQTREERQNLQGVQPAAEEEATSPTLDQGDAPSSPDVSTPQEFQEGASQGSPELDVSQSVSNVGGAEGSVTGFDARRPNVCIIAEAIQSTRRDPIARRASKILHYLLEKYQKDEQPHQEEMLKLISRKYKVHFPCILEKATYQLEVIYGLELKVDPHNSQSYVLVSKLPIPRRANQGGRKELPKTGLTLTLLGMIMMKGGRATEEEVWEFLQMQGLYPGRRHLLFGEPRKFITIELVEQNYVEYRRVPNVDPPRYEFLWGSRARNETTRTKVVDVLTKIRNAMPGFYPQQYEEALSNHAERAARRGEVSHYHHARIPSHAQGSSSSHT